jgi:hypothetical protein
MRGEAQASPMPVSFLALHSSSNWRFVSAKFFKNHALHAFDLPLLSTAIHAPQKPPASLAPTRVKFRDPLIAEGK